MGKIIVGTIGVKRKIDEYRLPDAPEFLVTAEEHLAAGNADNPDEAAKYAKQDRKRIAAFERGEWWY